MLVQTKKVVSREGGGGCAVDEPWWTDGVGQRDKIGEGETEMDKKKQKADVTWVQSR